MKKKQLVMILFILVLLFIVLANISTVFAAPNAIYDVLNPGMNPLTNAAGYILNIIRWVGVVILVGAIIVKGLKYVTSSPEGKADIKNDIIMLTVGAILLFAFTTFIDIIYDLVVKSGLKS